MIDTIMGKKIVVAIDGHSSCGKSTMAKALAKKVGYTYIDTGAMYRAVTLFALRKGLFKDGQPDADALERLMPDVEIRFRLNQDTNLPETMLNGECVEKEIRGMEVSNLVSPISTLSFVRKALVKQQQAMGNEKGIVMDGRDIGTVVFPHAELKVFVTATAEVRAKRRYDELLAKGETISFDEVLNNVVTRDRIDSSRADSPLKQAEDAFLLDNSTMSIEEQNQWLLERFEEATK